MTENKEFVWRENVKLILILASILALMFYIFNDGLNHMLGYWETREEYGHGYLIPFLVMFFIWQKKNVLEKMKFSGSWLGVVAMTFGLFMFYAGELSSLYIVIEYAFVATIFGVALSLMGWSAFRVIFVPLLLLFFMIPLPNFLFFNLSSQLQLISSEIGVAVIRLFDISVFLEGNVIDLGVFKLQVVEACSGLNYLFPLMTLAFITAYSFTGAFWKKSVIFLSSIPITILMNSFRIGVIGVTVEYWGIEMAEGFLHDFEGWAVFMSCIAILIIEMWILAKIGKDKLPLREAFGLDFPEPVDDETKVVYRDVPKPIYASLIVTILVALSIAVLPDRQEIVPDRKQYSEFPIEFEEWHGRRKQMEQIYIDELDFSDYTMIDYAGNDGGIVNLYSAYYESQRKGASIHSPRSCIPGGGWRITNLNQYMVSGARVGSTPLVVNRLVIQKGEIKQLVYYWFQQRSRVITNEYLMKWYLFWDAMTKNRSDGALMRLTTILNPGQDIKIADNRLEAFAKEISPIISEYVPQ